MKRWHEEIKVFKRQWRKHGESYRSDQYDDLLEERRTELGRYRKKHALDCGNPQCGVCHYHKFHQIDPHEQEVLSDISFREQLKELDS